MLNPGNQNRARAKHAITLSPGIHLRMLQRILGVSFSTARYHVRNLERDGEISRSQVGRYHRLYPCGTTDEMKRTYAVLQEGSARRVLKALADSAGGLTNGEIAKNTELSAATVGECLNLLVGVELAERRFASDGRQVYGALGVERLLPLLSTFERNLLDLASDRFIDLWDI